MIETDYHVGRILELLDEENLAENTLVIFTSDNGPWLSYRLEGGSAGLLRAGKGTTFEGGMRVPTIFWTSSASATVSAQSPLASPKTRSAALAHGSQLCSRRARARAAPPVNAAARGGGKTSGPMNS